MDLIVDFPRDARPPRARVSFAPRVETRLAEDLTVAHKHRLWHTESEMRSFKRDLAHTIRTILSTGLTVAEYAEAHVNDTSRFLGLESYLSRDTPDEVRARRRRNWEVVLGEQRRQAGAGGAVDVEGVAIVAREASEFSRRRARIIGLLHAPTRR